MNGKKRIDVLLVEQGFFDSREKAKRAVMAGIVHNDHEIIDKPGTKVPVDMELFVKGTVMPYVSRGGLKLEKALKYLIFQCKIVLWLILVLQQEDLQIVLFKMVHNVFML